MNKSILNDTLLTSLMKESSLSLRVREGIKTPALAATILVL
jgi:hypothetical protein